MANEKEDATLVASGVPDSSPTSGYAHKVPVKFADESEAVFQQRVAMYEGSLASAQAIVAGNPNISRRKALEAQYKADLANLDVVDGVDKTSQVSKSK